MKHRLIFLLLAVLLLCSGCAQTLVPSEYTVVTEHSETTVEEESDALTAESYEDLQYAILALIEDGVEHGVIRVYHYDGDVTKDISAAAYEVWKNDPMGAYAVEFITTDCNLLLSYYEIHVEITYRESAVESGEIRYVRGVSGAKEAIIDALKESEEHLVLRISAYSDTLDCEAIVSEYCAANPETQMEQPDVSAAVYPEAGSTRIVELGFQYENTPAALSLLQSAVNTVLNSAVNYVSYRDEDRAKAELLFSYLIERFEYTEGETNTPVYSLLCEGVANSRTFARIFQVLCDRVGLECYTVAGYLDGEEAYWNILGTDGYYGHVDLMRAVREDAHQLVYYSDEEMERYSWDRASYPVCGGPAVVTEAPVETPPQAPSPEVTEPVPEEPTVGEETPPAEENPPAEEEEPSAEEETPGETAPSEPPAEEEPSLPEEEEPQ